LTVYTAAARVYTMVSRGYIVKLQVPGGGWHYKNKDSDNFRDDIFLTEKET
jgi:hypothetical protein